MKAVLLAILGVVACTSAVEASTGITQRDVEAHMWVLDVPDEQIRTAFDDYRDSVDQLEAALAQFMEWSWSHGPSQHWMDDDELNRKVNRDGGHALVLHKKLLAHVEHEYFERLREWAPEQATQVDYFESVRNAQRLQELSIPVPAASGGSVHLALVAARCGFVVRAPPEYFAQFDTLSADLETQAVEYVFRRNELLQRIVARSRNGEDPTEDLAELVELSPRVARIAGRIRRLNLRTISQIASELDPPEAVEFRWLALSDCHKSMWGTAGWKIHESIVKGSSPTAAGLRAEYRAAGLAMIESAIPVYADFHRLEDFEDRERARWTALMFRKPTPEVTPEVLAYEELKARWQRTLEGFKARLGAESEDEGVL